VVLSDCGLPLNGWRGLGRGRGIWLFDAEGDVTGKLLGFGLLVEGGARMEGV